MTHDTPDQIKARMQEYFHRAYALHDVTVIDEMVAENVVVHGLTRDAMRGRAAFKKWYLVFSSSFSEVTCIASHTIVEGQWASSRVVLTAVHTGAGIGPPASGKKVHITALVLVHWQNHQIVEGFNELNERALLEQIS